MKIKIELNTQNAKDEIEELNDFIKEKNLKGLISKLEDAPIKNGTMDIGTYMPIIQMTLASGAVAAGVKGLFDIIKKWFDVKMESSKLKSEEKKVTFTKLNKDGVPETISMSLFNEKERKQFIKFFDK